MSRKHSVRFLCAVLAFLLLSGCTGAANNQSVETNTEQENQTAGTLTVYTPEKYRASVQQVFSHINLVQEEIRVVWSENFDAADIVITDSLPRQDHEKYRVIPYEELDVQGINGLAVYSDQGVIGVPVFLRLDGFWFDQHLFDRSDMEVPQSMDSWQSCELWGQYPIVCDQTDMCALFWSVVAPYYLKCGGSIHELSEGNFRQDSLLAALKQLESMRDSQFVQLSDQAWREFTSMQAAYWLTCVDNVAAYYNHTSNRSSWNPSLTLPFGAQEQAICVIRADVMAVRKDADIALTECFLEHFFNQRTLSDLSTYSRLPLACRMSYTPDVVPQLPKKCYSMLSSPMVEIVTVSHMWSETEQKQVYEELLQLMNGNKNAVEATDSILSSGFAS